MTVSRDGVHVGYLSTDCHATSKPPIRCIVLEQAMRSCLPPTRRASLLQLVDDVSYDGVWTDAG